MIRLEVKISNIDYDTLIEKYLPVFIESFQASNAPISMLVQNGLSDSFIKNIITKLNYDQKNKLTAELINSNSAKISEMLVEVAEKNNIIFDIDLLKAESD